MMFFVTYDKRWKIKREKRQNNKILGTRFIIFIINSKQSLEVSQTLPHTHLKVCVCVRNRQTISFVVYPIIVSYSVCMLEKGCVRAWIQMPHKNIYNFISISTTRCFYLSNQKTILKIPTFFFVGGNIIRSRRRGKK